MNDDAMIALERSAVLSQYKIGETRNYSDDGTIGIPYGVTVYYDRARGPAVPGYATCGGTPLMIYVINTRIGRVGTESDTKIVQSLLDRGYIVLVLDYRNNEKAVSPALDWSVQKMIEGISSGNLFPDDAILQRDGVYQDTLVLPAGYDVLLNAVYFELDRHCTDGTLEKIVNVWNNDFRKYKKEVTVKWVHEDGTRKPTQQGFDGTAPVWFSDADGTVEDAEHGQYTRICYTRAEEITDCVKSDGTPIDLKLRYDLIYPTKPPRDVPVVMHFSSTQYLPDAVKRAVRPQFTGFLFNGYAGAVFDYAYIPMCRNDHYGYFDGSGGDERCVTGYNPTFSAYVFNATQVSTAGVRFTRYLSLSDHDTYRFDNDRIGVFGVSKTSFITHLGDPCLCGNYLSVGNGGRNEREVAEAINRKLNSFYQWMYLPGHHGETRYDAGKTGSYTKDGFTIRGGELQPWLTFDGKEIPSGAAVVYSSCGATLDYIGKGYSPIFTTVNLRDGYRSGYLQQNTLVNLCRVHDIPSFWLEMDGDHTMLATGTDLNHGVNLYRALYDFFAYYLKDAPASVLFTDPANGCDGILPTRPITVKFIGEIPADEIKKISLTGSDGRAVFGHWVSSYGNTEWTFLHEPLDGTDRYTLTVPADLAGSNGKPIGREYTAAFRPEPESAVTLVTSPQNVTERGEVFIPVSVPALPADADRIGLRVGIIGGANELCLYSAASEGDMTGTLIGATRVSGETYAAFDVSDFLRARSDDKTVWFRLRTANLPGDGYVYERDFKDGFDSFRTDRYAVCETAALDGVPVGKITVCKNDREFGSDHVFYEPRIVLKNEECILNGKVLSEEDLGRTFRISLRVFDTVSRPLRLYLKSLTDYDDETRDSALYRHHTERFRTEDDYTKRIRDYRRVVKNVQTRANEWCEFALDYTVYEPSVGDRGRIAQVFYLCANPDGDAESPLYVSRFKAEEIITDLSIGKVSLFYGKTEKA